MEEKVENIQVKPEAPEKASEPPVQPQVTKTASKKPLLIILIVIVLFLVVGGAAGAVFFFGQVFKSQTQVGESPQPTAVTESEIKSTSSPSATPISKKVTGSTVPANWKSYTAPQGFSFQYPSAWELTPETEDGSVSLGMWGPSQKTETEFYDGVGLRFYSGSLGGKTLKEMAQAKLVEVTAMFEEEISPVSAVTIAGLSGYQFKTRGQIGPDTTRIFLPGKPGYYLEIQDMTIDPTHQGFAETVKQVLATLKIE